MKQILVTGCRGQLGSELQKLAPAYDETCVFHFTDVDELDITDRQAVYDYIESHSISIVVNCAAFTAVDKAESEPELCDLLNNVAPGYLAEAVESVGGTMIQVSTDYVFDGCGHRPYLEDDPTNPQTVYGRTKLEGEEAVIRTCAGSMVVRTAWLYSTFGNNFVKTMLRLGKERETLGVVFDQVGSPTYARDLAAFILTAIDRGIVPGVYHYTNEGVCSWYDFTRVIHRIAGIEQKDCKVRPILTEEYPVPAPRPHFSVLDKQKVKNTYGIDIPWWEDSLKECLKELL
ncbi:MAG: dTDP-4-dehydrorhamnose reductase [Bacteroidaceae bacterium]|nr:dTDP-4-dehydrorhamnose reductase [Bacteroidaceae bacterium]